MIDYGVKIEGGALIVRRLQKLKDGIERTRILRELARMAVDLIKVRTLSGKDERDRRIIPSKRAIRDGGQTLSDRGHMLGSMKTLGVTRDRATIGFGSALESKKAWWAHGGTKPHRLAPNGKSPLAWKPGGGRAHSGLWHYSRGHMHPGTPPRPFFGISPRDARELNAECNRLLAEALDKAVAA